MHVGWQVLLQVGDGGVQSLGQLDGAGVGLLGDCQQYGSVVLMTAAAISCTSWVDTTPRTMYSLPYS